MRTRSDHRSLFVPALFFVLGALALVLGSCENPTGELRGNAVPDTRLANIPANDTVGLYIGQGTIPEQTLYWAGDDPDGYVVAFQYRWIAGFQQTPDTTPWITILNIASLAGTTLDTLIIVQPGTSSFFRIYNFLATLDPGNPGMVALSNAIQESLATARSFAVPYPSGLVPGDSIRGADPVNLESPTRGSFIFNSPIDSNQHRFEVASVDNNDAVDPTPARVVFWTLPAPGLFAFFTSVADTFSSPFVLRCPTERAPGLRFFFGAQDPSTNERVYSYSVDDTTSWSPWNRYPGTTLTAADLHDTGSEFHRIYLRARNRWGVVSPDTSQRFRALIPPLDTPGHPQRILILNDTRWTMPGGIDSNDINNYYREIFDSLGFAGRYDIRMMGTGYSFPARLEMASYSLLFFVAEAAVRPIGSGPWLFTLPRQTQVREYLNIGGRLIWSGTPTINGLVIPYPSWARDIFHINPPSSGTPLRQNQTLDFLGVRGNLGYPDIAIDSAKTGPDSLYALRLITLNYPGSFGQTTSFFVSRDGVPFFDGGPVGIRYQSPPADPGPYCREMFSVVHFGFPLYYGVKSQVTQGLRKALQDLDHLP